MTSLWIHCFLFLIVCTIPILSIRGALFRSGRSLSSRLTDEELKNVLNALNAEASKRGIMASIDDPESPLNENFSSELLQRLRSLKVQIPNLSDQQIQKSS